jgi:adenosylcobinamide amidohydrolase
VRPELARRREAGLDLPVLCWRPRQPVLAVSSGPLGGGIGVRHWLLNATVPLSYARTDPDAHLAEIAEALRCTGPGVGLLTAVDVRQAVTERDGTERDVTERDGGVTVTATVGLGDPIWAAAPVDVVAGPPDLPAVPPGTINIVAWLPVRHSDAALVNAVATVTEAKVQALVELGVPGTGTCTDATVVCCPTAGPVEPYGGPRSTIGAPLARAVHGAVRRGALAWFGRADQPGSGTVRRDSVFGPGTKPT